MLHRDEHNPILTRANIPPVRADLRDVSSVFNPGAAMFLGRERLVLRVQTRGRHTVLMPAERTVSGDWNVIPQCITIDGLDLDRNGILHLYDPRLTVLDDVLYMVLAADVPGACRLVIASTTDFERWTLEYLDTESDTRNGVLFPARIGGRFARLDRPNRVAREAGPRTGSTITVSYSDDLRTWSPRVDVMSGRYARWDELIGAGPPPIRTPDGWLLVYHGVATHFASSNIYQAGVVLLDGDDPAHVLARGPLNILEPREQYECIGQVPNVVFPTGLVVEDVDANGIAHATSRIRMYYGAADTFVGLAWATVEELLAQCRVVVEGDVST
ncbi:MAG: glycoside hydrolase family 130 protein [Phycisphaerales bacterium]|nr:glycoside hydrolase family 130 protein [Phycisphaerales bacterium]